MDPENCEYYSQEYTSDNRLPVKYVNERMPVLDIEQRIEQIGVEGDSKHQILHSHYMKKIPSQNVMQAKIRMLVVDLVRVVRNVSELCNRFNFSSHSENA